MTEIQLLWNLFKRRKKLLHSLYFITYCIHLLFRGSSIWCCNGNYYNSLWCIKEFSWFLYCVLWCTIQSIFKEGWKRFFANGAKVFWKIVNVAEISKYLSYIWIIISRHPFVLSYMYSIKIPVKKLSYILDQFGTHVMKVCICQGTVTYLNLCYL